VALFQPIAKSPILRRLGGYLRSIGAVEPIVKTVAGEDEVVYLREGEHHHGSRPGIMQMGRTSRDQAGGFHKRLRAEAHRLAISHPVARKALRLRRSFVCQEGFKVEAESGNELVQAHLDKHWAINWERTLPKRVESLGTYGELLLFAPEPNKIDGHYELCSLDRESIEEILPCPYNHERPGHIRLQNPLRVTMEGDEKPRNIANLAVFSYNWQTSEFEGDTIYLGVNTLDTMLRGMSDLAPVVDWLDKFDSIAWTEAERIQFMKAFLWDVTLKGADVGPEAVRKRQAELHRNPPRPGTVNVHNESEVWEPMAPSLNTAESLDFLKFLFGIIWGGLDLPEHWYYSAASVNKASGEEMRDPAFAAIRDRKEDVAELLAMDGQIAVNRARAIPGHPLNLLSKQPGITDDTFAVRVTSRDPERSAYELVGASLQSLIGTLVVAVDEGYMSKAEAGKQFRQAAAALGLGDIPAPEEELDSIEQAAGDIETARQEKREDLEKQFPLAPGKNPDWAIKPVGAAH
jgi:hypothetical protein